MIQVDHDSRKILYSCCCYHSTPCEMLPRNSNKITLTENLQYSLRVDTIRGIWRFGFKNNMSPTAPAILRQAVKNTAAPCCCVTITSCQYILVFERTIGNILPEFTVADSSVYTTPHHHTTTTLCLITFRVE